MAFTRRFSALLCLVAVLLLAASPASYDQIWALVVPQLLLLAVLQVAATKPEHENLRLRAFPLLSFATPRAPPLA